MNNFFKDPLAAMVPTPPDTTELSTHAPVPQHANGQAVKEYMLFLESIIVINLGKNSVFQKEC